MRIERPRRPRREQDARRLAAPRHRMMTQIGPDFRRRGQPRRSGLRPTPQGPAGGPPPTNSGAPTTTTGWRPYERCESPYPARSSPSSAAVLTSLLTAYPARGPASEAAHVRLLAGVRQHRGVGVADHLRGIGPLSGSAGLDRLAVSRRRTPGQGIDRVCKYSIFPSTMCGHGPPAYLREPRDHPDRSTPQAAASRAAPSRTSGRPRTAHAMSSTSPRRRRGLLQAVPGIAGQPADLGEVLPLVAGPRLPVEVTPQPGTPRQLDGVPSLPMSPSSPPPRKRPGAGTDLRIVARSCGSIVNFGTQPSKATAFKASRRFARSSSS